MAYYRSNSSSGCLSGIIFIAIIGLITLYTNLTENSQKGLIKAARTASSEYSKCYKYEDYLDKYPEGKYQKEAENFIVSYYGELPILSTSSLSGSTTDNLSKIEKVKERLSVPTLNQRLDSLISAKVDEQYQSAAMEGTVEGWERYMRQLPEQYWRDANLRIDAIKNQMWGTEGRAWRTAQQQNTLAAYNRYIELYPNGAHARAADKKIIDLSVSNIFAGEHGSLPGMDKTSYSTSGINTISIKNDTQYRLTLLYSGPDSKRLVLSPGASGSVTLPNGTYRVAASVAAANVRSYAGTESLTGGGYEVSYYISTIRY